MTSRSDTTPLPTRVGLILVMAMTAAALIMLPNGEGGRGKPADIAPLLWLFTGLFVLRVAGQVLVAIRPRSWLPPMAQWNLVPYSILLPIQLVFIAVMLWIDLAFTSNSGIAVARHPEFGRFLLVFSAVYAGAMPIRYTLRMRRRPDQRWFGGTIPMVFHLVLASYLYTLGRFYAAG
ncbi:MAG: hypothetical protein R6W97_12585 [Thiobacillus sp.]